MRLEVDVIIGFPHAGTETKHQQNTNNFTRTTKKHHEHQVRPGPSAASLDVNWDERSCRCQYKGQQRRRRRRQIGEDVLSLLLLILLQPPALPLTGVVLSAPSALQTPAKSLR